MVRIKFTKKGTQREFIRQVLQEINCPSLRELINRGIDVNYSTLKNYFTEQRLIPESLFNELIEMGDLNKNDFDFQIVDDNFGQVIGGKKSRK
jgi:hypothetical protein